jgi:hypothetical protein
MRRITALMVLTVAMAVGATPAHASLPGLGQSNSSDVSQGNPSATGGAAEALAGNGGDAGTGNTQVLNGNSVSVAIGGEEVEANATGGDTSAESGDAYGGDGGDATAIGGDADASNDAGVGQSNLAGGDGPGVQENGSSIQQGSPEATGGDAGAEGGDGGSADTGNTQIGNGNAVAISVGGKQAEADAKGGDTSAKSGDAYGGDGGDAKAIGGDADSSNDASVEQDNESSGGGKDHGDRHGKDHGDRHDGGSSQSNESIVEQGSPEATGGEAGAEGGDGGSADTGNTQKFNGNALAKASPNHEGNSGPMDGFVKKGDDRCGCHDGGDSEADAKGGDTSAKSGDAKGGDGGDAKAVGGYADSWNDAWVKQSNLADGDGSGMQENRSSIEQGSPEATGGNAGARGGDGGSADTGNTQKYNGNAYAKASPDQGHNGAPMNGFAPKGGDRCGCYGRGDSEADAKGGDTSAESGDAKGGDGGDAKAVGGDADSSNEASVKQSNESWGHDEGRDHHGCGCHGKKDDGSGSQSNSSEIGQGSPEATGGHAGAEGGDGGSADTGNKQKYNGNAYAKASPDQGRNGGPVNGFAPKGGGRCGCHGGGRSEAGAWGGYTSAESGDAKGGDGGDAKAVGGDSYASNIARVFQLNLRKGGRF